MIITFVTLWKVSPKKPLFELKPEVLNNNKKKKLFDFVLNSLDLNSAELRQVNRDSFQSRFNAITSPSLHPQNIINQMTKYR